ncbi:hypothetical protein ABI_21720 [Asticcacaulis biprosthecium C19]|uniref:Uncharacterized protein n=1 Tax=Asticcacaulis biprosthecium C19 TaxID=715226 RepID=F4QGX7_9CAUL|nr:hypothetical protein ABI_21720 [Asticcacaulis biprosthecium C19]
MEVRPAVACGVAVGLVDAPTQAFETSRNLDQLARKMDRVLA